MRVAVLCATRRGRLFLEKLAELLPKSRLTVFSFPEEPEEPPFLKEIREFTLARGGEFFGTRRVESAEASKFWASTEVDVMFLVSWRYMIPAEVYRRPRLGTYVFHDSLLPAYRGFSPTVWAMINGETETGVTLFEIAKEVDAGDIVAQQQVPIGPHDAIGAVMERVTGAYLGLLEKNLEPLLSGTAARYPQDHARATYGCKRFPEDNRIDWTAPTERINNLIRAVSAPYSGAYTYFGGGKMRVWGARRPAETRRYVGRIPGRIVEVRRGEGAVVLTGDGALLLTEVETEGGGIVCAGDVLHGGQLQDSV